MFQFNMLLSRLPLCADTDSQRKEAWGHALKGDVGVVTGSKKGGETHILQMKLLLLTEASAKVLATGFMLIYNV